MRGRQSALILFLVLTAALILTACGDPSPAANPAPQSTQGAEAEETAETAATKAISAPEDAGGSDTAAGAVSLSYADCPSIPAEEYPRVDGSTATLPLSYALYQAATGEDEEAAMEAIKHNKTDSSYYQLTYGNCDLVLAYEPSENTRKNIEEKASLQMKPIGRDALVFMINASNPVKSLTEAQIQAVYTGEITNWKELGGNDEEIVAFQRGQNSGSQTLMEKLVMDGIPMAKAPSYHYISSMGELLDKVSSYNNQGNAIGYSVYFYARNMYSVPGLEFLSVEGVTPSNDTIRDGSYPYVNEFYAVIRDDEAADSPARLLFDWLTDEGGQELIADTGYVPVRDKRPAETAAAAALPITEQGETSYALKEDQVILLDGHSWFNSPAVHIMNADMTERALLEGYSLREKLMVRSINEPLILMDAATGKNGLYDIGNGKWILEPAYAYIYRNTCGDYVSFNSGETEMIYNGSEFLQIENGFFCTAGYYWIKDDTGYSIRKGGKEITGHVDVADPEQSSVSNMSPLVKLDPGTGRDYIYTADGELLFEPEYLQAAFENWQDLSYYIYGCTNTNGLLRIIIREDDMDFDTDEYWIYDIETGDLLRVGDEDVNMILCNKKGDYAFQINGESGLTILTDSLEPLKSTDGTPYEYCFGMDCYGYTDTASGNIIVENPDGSIHFEMPCHEDGSKENQGTMIAKGVILYTNWDKQLFELTRYGNLLFSSDTSPYIFISEMPGDYNSINQEYTACRAAESILIFRTDTGELTYQSSEDSLVVKDYPVLVFRSGSCLNFRDPNGDLVMKIFADLISED
ncbi:MAG: substrate-binding domain-containing protein [Eubacteriales bacterium]|nr:substrate-binding domain-containing protein [Eubacteriales bacterium]